MTLAPATVIVCRHCRAGLGSMSPGRLAFGGVVAVTGRVVLTCLRCGRQTTWRPRGDAPGGAGARTRR